MNYFCLSHRRATLCEWSPIFSSPRGRETPGRLLREGPDEGALDVGCGTGQSTLALLEIAEEVVGLDISSAMLSQAIRHEGIRYVEAPAERMPFDDADFGLVTVALAFHWFDQQKFALEARRVLRPNGWLVIYNDRFNGRMNGNTNYEAWYGESYLTRYPVPPRNNRSLSDLDALAYGLVPFGLDEFVHEVEFTASQLVDYLLTHTNVISAVEAGKEDLQSVTRWLLNSVHPLFSGTAATFPFSCQIQFLTRA